MLKIEGDGGATMTELGERFGVYASTIQRQLKRVVSRYVRPVDDQLPTEIDDLLGCDQSMTRWRREIGTTRLDYPAH